MSSVVISGDTSGAITLQAPAVAGSTTLNLPASSGTIVTDANGTLYPLVSDTAKSASGTAVDFTGIPSWVKRITVMFNGVSTSGASGLLIQIGSGSITTTGYVSTGLVINNASGTAGLSSTAGFVISATLAADIVSGMMTITSISSNSWISSHTAKRSTTQALFGAGNVSLSGTLDRVRITTVNGTDTFDAGTINILYE